MTLPLAWPPRRLFGVDWDRMALKDLRRFFAELADPNESLIWEAKGGDIRPAHVHEALSAFGNSTLGGYLILGAEGDPRKGIPWTTPGWRFPTEPQLWISQVASALIDGPDIDVRAWPTEDDRDVAVVAVPPAAVPPVITPGGLIFQRVVGASPKVTDPRELRTILDRGDAARERARTRAEQMRARAMSPPDGMGPPSQHPVAISIGLASTGAGEDVAAQLFTDRFAAAFRAVVKRHPFQHPGLNKRLAFDFSDKSMIGWMEGIPDEGYTLLADRDGSIGVSLRWREEVDALPGVLDGNRLSVPWGLADELVRELGGYGPAYLALYLHAPGRARHAGYWVGTGEVNDDALERIRRDLRRGRRDWAPEPE
jgi:hypothetical protein